MAGTDLFGVGRWPLGAILIVDEGLDDGLVNSIARTPGTIDEMTNAMREKLGNGRT